MSYPGGVLARAEHLRSGRTPFVLATVVRAMRPTSAKAGDRALILPDGTIEGFVGGECAEASVRRYGLQVLASHDPLVLRILPAREEPGDPGRVTGETLQSYAPQSLPDRQEHGDETPASTAESAGTGLVTVANPCASGGMLEIFLEGVFPPPLVLVHGDGPIANAVREVGQALGYDLRTVGLGEPAAPLPGIPPGTDAVIVASHGRDEAPVLAAALAAAVPYVGLVASRRRGAQVLAGLDVPAEAAARIRTPAGLDIGARTVQEVALSIFSEIVAERSAPSARRPADVAAGPDQAGLAAETDPVCGMQVALTASTIRAHHEGQAWYFCGSGCRDAFAADPSRFAAPGPAAGSAGA